MTSAGADDAGPRIAATPTAPGPIAPQVRLVALLCFVLAVVAVPRGAIWPFLAQLALLLTAATAARVGPGTLARGLALELPFVLFALALPFVAAGDRVAFAGLSLSGPGLWAAWALLAKGTLGILAATVLAASTRPEELLDGLRRLRVPELLTTIAGFMLRYARTTADAWRRMTIARAARAFRPRSPAAWPVLAGSLGGLFVRCYERGERVQLAMLSRGYSGSLPSATDQPAGAAEWARGLAIPALAAAVSGTAWALA